MDPDGAKPVDDELLQSVDCKEALSASLLTACDASVAKKNAAHRDALPATSLFARYVTTTSPEKPSDPRTIIAPTSIAAR